MDTREFIEFCTREEARLKWYAEARGVAEELLAVKKETEQAEQARDKAIADRDAAVADLEAKKVKYQREGEAALADLQRVIKEKTDLASAATARTAAELAQLRAEIEQAQGALAEGQVELNRFRRTATEEMTAIQAQLDTMRAERQAIRERVAAALKE